MTLEIAIAQFRPHKGEPEASLAAFDAALEAALRRDPRPGLIVFPETALSGYFLEGGVRERARSAEELLAELGGRHTAMGAKPVDVAIGFYELHERQVYNSALYATLDGDDSRILHLHRKVFLPTYGVFQEERFVEAGSGIAAFDTAWGRAALLVCEDAFHGISPTVAALDGADVLLVLSASPARGAQPGPDVPDSLVRWDMLGSAMAAEHGLFVVISQLTGFEGGKGFAGGSSAYSPRGRRLVYGPLWEPAVIPVSLDLEEIAAARSEEPLLADLQRVWTRLLVNSPGARVGRPGPAAEEPPNE